MTSIDTHAHVWDLSRPWMAWLRRDPFFASVARTVTVADLEAALTEADEPTDVVLVEAAHVVEESIELLAVAAGTATVRGVVGWVDLGSEQGCRRDLARLRKQDPAGALVGIRHYGSGLADDPLVDGRLTAAVRVLADERLVLEVHVPDATALAAVTALARAVPEVTLVLDHLGKPDVRLPIREQAGWAAEIQRLAPLRNVHVKLSGWATRLPHPDPAAVRPFVRHVLEHVGAARVLLASNWPVALVSGGYGQTIDATMAALDGLTDADGVAGIRGANAERVYQLPARDSQHLTTTMNSR